MSAQTQSATSETRIKEFRSLLKRAVLLDQKETALLDTVPDVLLERILSKNFNDNMALAERILLNRYHEIDSHDRPALEQRKKNIRGLDRASKEMRQALKSGRKILVLTDNDNDGSMAQSVFLEFHKALPRNVQSNVHRAYAQPIGSARGLNKENIDLLMDFLGWSVEDDVLIITADIGINNRVEQERIQEAYPNTQLIVTDHHLPVAEHVVQENKRTWIVNPQVQPTDYFKKKNISGANTLSVLLKDVLQQWKAEGGNELPSGLAFQRVLDNMDEISSWSNLLDYVEADVADMPLRPYTIKKALSLRSLMNVSNSMGPLVTLDWKQADWDRLAQEAPGLDVLAVKEHVDTVKGLNRFAQKMLAFISQYSGQSTFSEKDFYPMLSEVLTDEDTFEGPNPNYIAQLRPHVFHTSAVDDKYAFSNMANEEMIALYEGLRTVEKELVTLLREHDMLNRIKGEYSTIVYPKSEQLTRIFSRKLLNKIYNEENTGFFLTLDKTSAGEYSGSMRSVYPMNEILPDEEDLENKLGIDIEVLGHAKAAGFKIHPRPGTVLNDDLLKKLNDELNTRVAALAVEEKAQSLPYLEIDFASVGLVHKINTAVKAHLSNMNGLPCVLRLGAPGKNTVWVTDAKTTEQIDLAEVVSRKTYGYLPIQTDFDGNAFIIPVEQLRRVVANRFRPYVKLSYMDDGVFIAHQAVDAKALKNIIPFKGDRTDQSDLLKYYWDNFLNDQFMALTQDDFRALPYFRFNSYGQSEFEHWEQLVINLLAQTHQDVLAVIDTEGTGLGQAPKCFNIGGTNIRIKEGSGQSLDEAEFDRRLYRDASGQAYLLTDEHLAAMTASPSESDVGWRVFNSTSSSVDHDEEYLLPAKPEDAIRLKNYTRQAGEVLFNRTIEGVAFSFLVRDTDFAITPEFENLTGISQDMVQRFGMNTDEVDEKLADFYTNMKTPDGKAAKIIFSAHNLPYDKGVVSSNFTAFNDVMDQHLLCDTAKLSRQAKLAYDDTPVASFSDVSGISAKVYFYDSPYSSYSLSTFIDRMTRGKGGVYPDTTGRYLLRYDAKKDELSFIDKKEINEILLDEGAEGLLSKRTVSQMPNNAVKYSVERLSQRAMIRNIILHDYQKPRPTKLEADEMPYEKALTAFQDQYHFDNTLEDNIRFFLSSRHNAVPGLTKDMVCTVGERFLNDNRDIQAKFHDGWIYEKVLSLYEPEAGVRKVPKDAMDQVNYYTDLPRKKIEKVFQDTLKFKDKFGIKKALVHEQHNNIRQRSEDGHGLSDTAYESVLPNMLAMMKFYNPYTQSSHDAVSEIIKSNIKGAMLQLMVKKDHADMPAIDSFSMRQLQAFDRDMKTGLVARAQEWAKSGGWDGANTPIKFKLGSDTLPPGSGVYGVPKRPLTAQELEDSSEKLEFIMLNEQLRSSASMSRSISVGHGGRLRDIAAHNDTKAIEYRTVLLDRFERIDFQRKEATIKKLSEMMSDVFQGLSPPLTHSLITQIRQNPDLLLVATDLELTHHEIERRLGRPSFLSPETAEKITKFLSELADLVQCSDDDLNARIGAKAGGKIKRASKAKPKVSVELPYAGSMVRNDVFLNDLDIRRDEPLRFILKQSGPRFFSTFLNKQAQDNAPAAPVVPSSVVIQGTTRGPR